MRFRLESLQQLREIVLKGDWGLNCCSQDFLFFFRYCRCENTQEMYTPAAKKVPACLLRYSHVSRHGVTHVVNSILTMLMLKVLLNVNQLHTLRSKKLQSQPQCHSQLVSLPIQAILLTGLYSFFSPLLNAILCAHCLSNSIDIHFAWWLICANPQRQKYKETIHGYNLFSPVYPMSKKTCMLDDCPRVSDLNLIVRE